MTWLDAQTSVCRTSCRGVHALGTMRRALGACFGLGHSGSAGSAGLNGMRGPIQISRGSGGVLSATRSADQIPKQSTSKTPKTEKATSKRRKPKKASSKKNVPKQDIPSVPKPEPVISTFFPASHWAAPQAMITKLDTWGSAFLRVVRECGRVGLAARGILPTWPSRDQLLLETNSMWEQNAPGLRHLFGHWLPWGLRTCTSSLATSSPLPGAFSKRLRLHRVPFMTTCWPGS